MGIHLASRRRIAALALAALGAILCLAPATASAGTNPGWYGWGVKVRWTASGANATFVAYIAEDGATPRILASQQTPMTCAPRGTGTISYTTSGATFDGRSYLACQLPAWDEATSDLGFTLPGGGEPLTCPAGGAPLWGDVQATPRAVSGDLPVFDASDGGIRLILESTGAVVRSRLDLAQVNSAAYTSYRSPSWTIGTTPVRSVIGMEGDGLVTVADAFSWLDYLADLRWRSFYRTNVEGAYAGSWVENGATTTTARTSASRYSLKVDGGTFYIGYSPASGRYFDGTIGPGGVEPGCKGL